MFWVVKKLKIMILNQINILLLIMIMIFEENRRHKEINYIKNDKKVKEQTNICF